MHASVLGNVKSGKSTLGAALLAVVLMVRAELEEKVGRGGRGRKRQAEALERTVWATFGDGTLSRKVVGVATERTSGLVLQDWRMETRRTRSLAGVRAAIGAAAGGAALLDTATAVYERALESWRDQSNHHRDLVGLAPQVNLTPAVWQVLNRRYREAITEAADQRKVDLVEVHRQGPGFVLHPDYGLVEGEGLRPRGQSESGSQADLLLWVDGGLKAKTRPSMERGVVVISDPAELAVGKSRELPELRSFKDREELVRLLFELLAPSLRLLIPRADEEREAWATVLAEGADDWPEAREHAEKSEAERLVDTVKLVLMRQGVLGQSEDARGVRTEGLLHAFGVGDVQLLLDVPVERLRRGVPELERYLAEDAARRVLVAGKVYAIREVLVRHGVDGGKAIQKALRGRAMAEVFGVVAESAWEEALSKLPAEHLAAGLAQLPTYLAGIGAPEVPEG